MTLAPLATDFKSTTTGAATLAFTAFSPAVGEFLVVKVVGEVGGGNLPAVPSGGPTFTAATAAENVTTQAFVDVYTATVGSAGSITITVTAPNSTGSTPANHWSCQLERWPVGCTLGAVRAAALGTGAPSTTVTTTGTGSAVSWCNGDFAAVSPTGHTYNTTSATPTEENVDDQSAAAAYVAYYAYQQSATAGSQTLGLTAPTGQTWCIEGVEVIPPGAGDAGPQIVPLLLPALSYSGDDQSAPTATIFPMRPWQRRFQWVTQPWLNTDDAVTAATVGPPVYPLGHPVQARRLPLQGGRVACRRGLFAGVGPPVKPPEGPVQARRLPTRGGSAQARTGVFGGVGPALRALASAVTARLRTLPPRGRSTGRSGVYAGLGPPVKPAEGPVAAKSLPQRGGRVGSRAGTFTATAPTAGPPIYPLGHPVQARRLPTRGGRVTRAAGTYAGTGPPVKSAEGPVRAQALPARGGRVVARVGTFTAGAPPAGPPVYPLGHPVCARRLPARGGYVNRRSGPYAGTGPAAPQLRQPVAGGRQQPPPPVRGRIGSLRGPFQGTGPRVRPLSGPVRARLPGPVRTGRVDATLLPAVAVPPPPFSIGVLTATGFAPGTSAADYAPTEAASGYAPGSSATDKRTGGPS